MAVIDAIYDDAGVMIGFGKITSDITERQRAHESLKDSERRFRLLLESVVDYAIYQLDTNGYVTTWNAGAERIKGYRPEEIIGQHFSRFYTDEDRAATFRPPPFPQPPEKASLKARAGACERKAPAFGLRW